MARASHRSSLKNDPVWQEALDWFMRVQATPGDKDLRAARDAWLGQDAAHRRAYKQAERVWLLSGDLAPAARPRGRVLPMQRYRYAAAALAACLLLALYPSLQLWALSDYRTAPGEIRQISLNDGSILHLDGDSAVAVHYSAGKRTVDLLSGRAFFDVSHNTSRPFQVLADGIAVTVTGTKFGVGISDRNVSVAVQEGSVRVAADSDDHVHEVALTRGDRVIVDKRTDELRMAKIAPDNVASWRSGRLTVDGATVADVVDQFRRYHRGMILLRGDGATTHHVTGVFDLTDPLAGLQALVQPSFGSVRRITPFLLVVNVGQ